MAAGGGGASSVDSTSIPTINPEMFTPYEDGKTSGVNVQNLYRPGLHRDGPYHILGKKCVLGKDKDGRKYEDIERLYAQVFLRDGQLVAVAKVIIRRYYPTGHPEILHEGSFERTLWTFGPEAHLEGFQLVEAYKYNKTKRGWWDDAGVMLLVSVKDAGAYHHLLVSPCISSKELDVKVVRYLRTTETISKFRVKWQFFDTAGRVVGSWKPGYNAGILKMHPDAYPFYAV